MLKLLPVEDEVNADAIDLIEGLLARLKTGEAIAAAFVEVKKGNTIATAWSKTTGGYHLMNSGAARLSTRLSSDPQED